MKVIIGPLGRQDVSVTSGAQVNVLQEDAAITAGSNANAISLQAANVYALVVYTTQEITLRIYRAAHDNAGLRPTQSVTVAAGDSYSLEVAGNAMNYFAVTAQATSTTAAVSADFVAKVYP